ncbi:MULTISPECIES: hypothetical protein [unclassified Mycobacterium]|uniref:hypothetical protein n=1 Tax=unclassified Mycobacterium TaxID=2642494 RepID=UPI000A59D4B2|nr:MULTISPECIES: hypothetical protein [unclassified Mycobacterium]
MSIEHLPSALLAVTVVLRLARLMGRRVRALIRTTALGAGLLLLVAAPHDLPALGPLLHTLSTH